MGVLRIREGLEAPSLHPARLNCFGGVGRAREPVLRLYARICGACPWGPTLKWSDGDTRCSDDGSA